MSLSTRQIEALVALVGPEGVIVEPDRMRSYETGARYGSGRAAAVVRPADTAQVSAVVAWLVGQGVGFVPQSGNTGLAGGSVPDASGSRVVLSLERLRSPLDVDPVERMVTVGAGVRLSALNQALASHGLFLPIDLGSDPMLGGMVSTNTAGARFLRYGDMRRHVRGLEVVLADAQGTVLDLMSPLRKDNARLDLKHLFIGSAGAFGVVTRAVVEVVPSPTLRAAAVVVPSEPALTLDVLVAAERAFGDRLAAFEGMSKNAMARALAHVPGLRNPFANGEVPDFAVLMELADTGPAQGQGALETALETFLGALFGGDGAPIADALIGAPEPLWTLRHNLSEGLRASGAVVGLDLSFRRRDLFAFRQEAQALLARDWPAYTLCDFGHVGDGGMHFNLVRAPGPAADQDAAVSQAVTGLAIERYGASFSGEHGLGPATQRIYDRYTPELIKAYAAGLQTVFAPARASGPRFGPSPDG